MSQRLPDAPVDRWTTLGLAAAGAGVPLAWCRLVSDEYITPELVVLCAGLLVSAFAAARRKVSPSLSTPLDRPLAAVLLAGALSTTFSLDPRVSLAGTYGSYTYGLWQVAACALLFQLTSALAGDAERRLLLKAGVGAAALASAYAVVQAAGLDPFVPAGTLAYGRAMSTLASPVFLGAYLTLWLPVALHWALGEPGEERFGRTALALIAAGLLATVSRGAWLAAALGAVVYLRLAGRLRAPGWSWRRWAAVAAGAALAAAWAAGALARRGAADFGREGERLAIWGVAFDLFRAHPWLGVGPDAFELGLRQARTEGVIHVLGQGLRLGHAHNDLLQIAATTGLLGLGAYLWLLAALVAEAKRALAADKDRARAAALAAGLTALFVNLQLNIVSLPAYVSAALAAGLLVRPRAAGARGLKLGAAVVLASVSAFYALRLADADREFKLAASAGPAAAEFQLRSALALNPCELTYGLAYVNLLSARIGRSAGADRLDAADRIAELGGTALACHRNDAVAHYILGSGALMQALLGRPERLGVAEGELDAALRLDPFRQDLLDWRRQAATARGDKPKEQELLDRLARVRALRP